MAKTKTPKAPASAKVKKAEETVKTTTKPKTTSPATKKTKKAEPLDHLAAHPHLVAGLKKKFDEADKKATEAKKKAAAIAAAKAKMLNTLGPEKVAQAVKDERKAKRDSDLTQYKKALNTSYKAVITDPMKQRQKAYPINLGKRLDRAQEMEKSALNSVSNMAAKLHAMQNPPPKKPLGARLIDNLRNIFNRNKNIKEETDLTSLILQKRFSRVE